MPAIAVLPRNIDAGTITSSPGEPGFPSEQPLRRPHTIVRVDGELDASVCAEFRDALDRAVTVSSCAVVVDLGRIRFLSIGCAIALAAAKDAAERAEIDLRVVAGRREVERVLEVTGMRPLLRYYPSVQVAMEA